MYFVILQNSFVIELNICGGWHQSVAIDLAENKCTGSYMHLEHISLEDKTTIHLLFHTDMGVSLLY